MGKQKKGLEFDTLAFSPQSGSPPETKLVTAEIKDFKGNVIFRQEDVEIPTTWDQQAANVVASKYFYGPENAPRDLQVSAGGRERSVIQLVRRVAGAIANKGVGLGYFASPDDHKRFLSDLQHICWGQYASFNSPVWFNVGLWDSYGIKGGSEGFGWRWDQRKAATTPLKPGELYVYPQASACFIISVDDNLKSIFERSVTEGMLFKYGSGVGADNSTIRSRHEVINGGGRPSGPLSFMGIYDAVAKVTHSGGRVRRAAKIEILRYDHPDIEDFIDAKWLEEQKAKALIRQGYPADFNGDAYRTVNFQNSNFAVRATDEFMRKAAGEDPTRSGSRAP